MRLIQQMPIIALMTAAVAASFTACNNEPGDSRKEIVLSRGEELANDGINNFGIEFFKQLAHGRTPNNYAVSPVSAALTMSMIANATDAVRTAEILGLLACNDLEELNSLAGKLTTYLPEDAEKSKLYLSNSVWHKPNLSIKETFAERMRNSYKAAVSPLDFTDTGAASGEINRWCVSQTNGMIEKIVDPKELSSTVVFLANALYFKDDWKKPFETGMTKQEIFHGIESDKPVSMMKQTALFDYYGTDEYQAVSLPYINDYEFIAVLPAENIKIDNFVDSFSKDDYEDICKRSSEYTVVLSLPKFKYSHLTNATEAIKAMGVDLNNVRLSGMYDRVEEMECAIKIKDAASIELDEKGTKAAVVTTGNGMSMSPGTEGNDVVKVVFDRPFIYFIRNINTGSIIMAGQFAQAQ